MIAEAGVPFVLNEKLDRSKGIEMDGQRITSITTLGRLLGLWQLRT